MAVVRLAHIAGSAHSNVEFSIRAEADELGAMMRFAWQPVSDDDRCWRCRQMVVDRIEPEDAGDSRYIQAAASVRDPNGRREAGRNGVHGSRATLFHLDCVDPSGVRAANIKHAATVLVT